MATLHLAKGDNRIEIELYPMEAPNTVNSFVFLARDGYYDDVTFHRVVAGFVIQTGDPTGTGKGRPGYTFDNELAPNRRHDGPGVVAMANSGLKDGRGTNGSQFYITFEQEPQLDGLNADGTPKDCSQTSCHPVFGRVISGMEFIDQIAKGDRIKTITVTESAAPPPSS